MSAPSGNALRDLVSLGVIVAGAVVGLHLVAGEPVRQRAERAQRAVQAAQARLNEVVNPTPLGVGEAATLSEMRRRAREIADESARGADQLRVYGAVTTIASECAVQIDRMEPASGGSAMSDDHVRAQAYEISAVATFPAIVSFIDRLQHDAGYTRVTGFSVEPEPQGGRPTLRVTIRTLHYAFDLGEAEALLREAQANAPEEDAS
ncbi:MAG: hypothetical protein ACF8QF_03125 [Phycisphaerales bacterium]